MNMFAYPMITLLTAETVEMTFSERFSEAMTMLIVGMLMIFSVLSLLWGVLALFRIFFYDMPRKRAQEKTQAAESTMEQILPAVPAPAPAPAPTPTPVANDDAALVAAITAAIAAALAEDGYTGGFRVVSFRRAENARAWNRK